MKRRLENIFDSVENYNCFACGPNHPFGLHLTFEYDDAVDEVSCLIRPDMLFAGFPGILHGGIQATILDEVAFWGTWGKHGRSGFTYDLTIRYRQKCPVETTIEAIGIVHDEEKRLVPVDVVLRNPDTGMIYTDGRVRYYLPRMDPRNSGGK
ncbi:PaaI family thioesterase [bacterium]|nr:PaaI family thioesterase [candidate division CSSED10-310 bacterium]